MRKLMTRILAIGLMLATLSGCVSSGLNVVVTSYPLEYLVNKIAGDRVTVHRLDEGNMLQRSTMTQDYETILSNADVIFYINEAQPYFELYEDEIKASKARKIDLSQYSRLYDFKRYHNVNVSGKLQTLESDYYETPLLNDYDMYERDPILWIYPMAMVSMGRSISDFFVNKYPDQAKYYNDNFAKLEVDLVRLYADYQKLKERDVISFVSLTPSYGNWQKSYGVNVYPLVLSKYGVLPDEELLNVYRERIVADDVHYIVYEESYPQDYINFFNKVKTELSLEQITLHNLYTLSDKNKEDNEDYISLMYKNLDVLLVLSESIDEEHP